MIKSLKEIAQDLRVKTGYTIAFIILLVSYLLSFYGNNQLIKQAEWVNHTNKVILNLEILASGMKDAENGLRGYINTKDTTLLLPYKNSFVVVNNSLIALKEDTKDDDFQQKQLNKLSSLISERYNRLVFTLDHFRRVNYVINDTILKAFYSGKTVMDSVLSVVSVMEAYEQNMLAVRNTELDAKYNALNIILITSLVVALVLFIFGFYTYRSENKARIISENKVEDYQKELQQRILELENANASLVLMKQSEKFAATGRIARIIAHEVRNPLTNIDLAVAQIKGDKPVEDEGTAMLFDMVLRNSNRINQLISELLNATRFTELNYAPVSINSLMDEALSLAKDRLELNNIKVDKNYTQDICNISADLEKLKIALLNLIVNAIEAMEPGKGILQIITKGENDKCVIEITDNGSGMTDEELNTIFEPYFSKKPHGNGMGLTNAANIILNHKGDISVVSKPGQGTTFTIKFDFLTQP